MFLNCSIYQPPQDVFVYLLFFLVDLVSAGIELIFFLLAGTVLFFGFRMREMLIAHSWFGCCSAVVAQGLPSLSYSASE